jgi:hypothetical protein
MLQGMSMGQDIRNPMHNFLGSRFPFKTPIHGTMKSSTLETHVFIKARATPIWKASLLSSKTMDNGLPKKNHALLRNLGHAGIVVY